MINFFCSMIRQGKMTLEDVPEKWHDKVAEELQKAGR